MSRRSSSPSPFRRLPVPRGRVPGPLELVLVAAVGTAVLALGCGGGASQTGPAATYERHERHRDEAIERCLRRCQDALGPGDTNQLNNTCEAQCYPYLVNTDQVREEVELREGNEPGTDPTAEPAEREDALAPVAAPEPEPEYETEHYDE